MHGTEIEALARGELQRRLSDSRFVRVVSKPRASEAPPAGTVLRHVPGAGQKVYPIRGLRHGTSPNLSDLAFVAKGLVFSFGPALALLSLIVWWWGRADR